MSEAQHVSFEEEMPTHSGKSFDSESWEIERIAYLTRENACSGCNFLEAFTQAQRHKQLFWSVLLRVFDVSGQSCEPQGSSSGLDTVQNPRFRLQTPKSVQNRITCVIICLNCYSTGNLDLQNYVGSSGPMHCTQIVFRLSWTKRSSPMFWTLLR